MKNCCDPREANTCTGWWHLMIGTLECGPNVGGSRFDCVPKNGEAGTGYGWPSCECWDWPCVEGWQTKPRTVGDDVECEGVDGATCIPWFADGDAPAGIEDLGMCARADSGPCVGVPARECVTWGSNGSRYVSALASTSAITPRSSRTPSIQPYADRSMRHAPPPPHASPPSRTAKAANARIPAELLPRDS